MKSDINCVIVHKGYKPYLKYNLEITSKNNKIYLIGDKSLEKLQNISKNITYIDKMAEVSLIYSRLRQFLESQK